MSIPKLSFAVPAYNRPDLLKETLNSIYQQEGLEDYEVIITDDLGLPETREVAASFPSSHFKYYANEKQLGGVENWNRALSLCRGEWVTVIHEDDLFYPWFYQFIKKRLRSNISALCVKSVVAEKPPRLIRDPNIRVFRYKPGYFIKSAFTPFPGVVFKRELLTQIGYFNPQWESLADYEFWYRLALSGHIEIIKSRACFYRISDSQWTNQAWPTMLKKSHLLRLKIAREQFNSSTLSIWMSRFFTYRNAVSYAKRFDETPAVLKKCIQFKKIPFSSVPSGWAWQLLKLIS